MLTKAAAMFVYCVLLLLGLEQGLSDNVCRERSSCFSKRSWSKKRYECLCDIDCLIYHDCCPDVFSSCFGIEENDTIRMEELARTEVKSNTGHVPYWSEKTRLKENSECRPTRRSGDIWMVSKCPVDWGDDSVRAKCENSSLLLGFDIPVAYNNIPYTTFKNWHCAFCNGVSFGAITKWEWRSNCQPQPNFTDIIESEESLQRFLGEWCQLKQCVYDQPPIGFSPRLCELNWPLTQCNDHDYIFDNKAEQRESCLLCNVIRSPIGSSTRGEPYKNRHCGRALNVSLEGLSPSPWRNSLGGFVQVCIGIQEMFNFRTGFEALTPCKEGEILIGGKCRRIGCSEGHVEVNGTCVAVSVYANRTSQIFANGSSNLFVDLFFPSLSEAVTFINRIQKTSLFHPFWNNIEFENNIAVTSENLEAFNGEEANDPTFLTRCSSFGFPQNPNVLYLDKNVYDKRVWSFTTMLSELPNSLIRAGNYITKRAKVGLNATPNPNLPLLKNQSNSLLFSNSFVLSFQLNDTIPSSETIQDLYDFYFSIIHFVPQNTYFAFSLRNFPSDIRFKCPSTSARIVSNMKLDNFDNVSFLTVDERYFYPIDNVPYIRVIGSTFKSDPCNVAAICETLPHHLNCKVVVLESDEYVMLENEEVKIGDKTIKLEDEYYAENRKKLYICENLIKTSENTSNPARLVDIIFSSLTIAALIITFLVYCLLPELRNIPGKCLMTLCITLTLSHLLLLFDRNNDYYICFCIAVGAHFMWLSSFSWMSIMAFDIVLTFRGRTNRSSGWGRFLRYMILAYFFPTSVVSLAVVLDLTNSSLIQVDYGQMSTCWIVNKKGAIVFFGFPVFISLVFNLVCFGLILHAIEKTSRESSMASERLNNKKRYMAYVRISFVIGFTWLFGFLNAWLDNPGLLYTYLALNGLQGVFIAVSFLANARTRLLLKKRFGKTEFSHASRPISNPCPSQRESSNESSKVTESVNFSDIQTSNL